MPVTQSARRSALVDGEEAPGRASGSIRGLELFVMPKEGLGIYGRRLTGSFVGTSRPLLEEVGVLLGDPTFRIEAAYVARPYVPQDSTLRMVRAGFAGTSRFGTSGVSVRLRGGYFAPIERFKADGEQIEGWEGETSLAYTWDRYPLSAQLGYRIERLRVRDFEEETSALTLGIGIWLQRLR
jgi:hypothetical protein